MIQRVDGVFVSFFRFFGHETLDFVTRTGETPCRPDREENQYLFTGYVFYHEGRAVTPCRLEQVKKIVQFDFGLCQDAF